jgi:hypothetical protein
VVERWWRVVRWVAGAQSGRPGHPAYVPVGSQGAGRFDNPGHYTAGYLAAEPECAVAETLGNLKVWTRQMLRPGEPPDATMALAAYDGDLALVDLDDAATLTRLGLRPSDVVRRHRARTQEVALQLFLAGGHDGIRWWSYHRPQWTVATVWKGRLEDGTATSPLEDLRLAGIEELTLDHRALVAAAEALPKIIEV